MAQPSDVNVDDLRRRARRRLVGAIVLALSAAVFVPMLLESEPKPLGEDVSVKIPPVDSGKFVTKLNAKGGGDAAKAPAKSEPVRVETPKPESTRAEPAAAEPATSSVIAPSTSSGNAATPAAGDGATVSPKRSLAEAEQKVLSPSAKAPTAVTPPVPKAQAAPTPAATVAQAPSPAAAEALKVVPAKTEPAKTEPAKAETAKESAKVTSDVPGFSVQLAAFSDDKGANSLANKLKKTGYAAYTEPLTTSAGTKLWRVRVGPFATRDAAGTVRDKLKGDGYIGIVAPAK